jgi:hypothetical protein
MLMDMKGFWVFGFSNLTLASISLGTTLQSLAILCGYRNHSSPTHSYSELELVNSSWAPVSRLGHFFRKPTLKAA